MLINVLCSDSQKKTLCVATPLTSYRWETRKMAGDMACGRFRGGPQNGRKMAGQIRRQKMAKFQLPGHLPAILQPCYLPEMAARHFASHFKTLGNFQFRARFPPAAGQRGRNHCGKQKTAVQNASGSGRRKWLTKFSSFVNF